MNTLYQGNGLKKQDIQTFQLRVRNSLKIVLPLVGLAAILATSTQTEVGRSIRQSFNRYVGNVIDNAIYGKDVTSQRYVIMTYEIKPGDDSDTVREMTGNNEMAYDYTFIANNINPNDLRPGVSIKIPIPSSQGKNLPELFRELALKKR